jgi:hypothetical protein
MISGFTLHDTATAPEGSAEILKSVQKAWSFAPNRNRVLAESPAALEAYSMSWAIAENTSFTLQDIDCGLRCGPIACRQELN